MTKLFQKQALTNGCNNAIINIESEVNSMNEMLILKMNLLGGMNTYVRDLGDEEAWDLWITIVPDEVTEDDLEYIANDKELWTDVCVLFGEIVKNYSE